MSSTHPVSWHLGLIGFSYPEWSRTLYSTVRRSRLRGDQLLRIYSTAFNATEVNTTFYGTRSPDELRVWADSVPQAFRFSFKMPRDVTHGPTPEGALASTVSPPGHLLLPMTIEMARQFVQIAQLLGERLGAVLLQFPPKFGVNRRDELAAFLDSVAGTARLAVEFRNASWWDDQTASMLRDRHVCWVSTDEAPQNEAFRAPDPREGGPRSPRPIMVTTDFLYVRWLGKHGQFKSRNQEHFDPSERLLWWADRLRRCLADHPEVRAIWAFFDNDFAGHAPSTARRFARVMGLPLPALPEDNEPTLFG